MILILDSTIQSNDQRLELLQSHLRQLPNIKIKLHQVTGSQQTLHEIYLIGDTHRLDEADICALDGVERVVRISSDYRILGRHEDDQRSSGFSYQGIRFSQDSLQIFAGLCAVDTAEHVDQMMAAVAAEGLQCTRMGAYKPRTNPYSFQGHGASCLPWVFESAGRHGIKVIAMEVTHESHITEIEQALAAAGDPCGVIMQVGTRNTQNFELLKALGRQRRFPVLLKRGFGITLDESINAAEYLASEGNDQVIFCLRGVKTNLGDPHRNLVDFAHVPAVKDQTRMPVCIDPSHSVGRRHQSQDGILDLLHATAQGVIAGANMILIDFHPDPATALVDGAQALTLAELPRFVEDVRLTRAAYEQRVALYKN